MKLLLSILALALLLPSSEARAQQLGATNQSPLATAPASLYSAPQQPVGAGVARTIRKFSMGFSGGVGLDPELVDFGVHAHIARVFTESLSFRPGLEVGLGEITTLFNINLDLLYTFPGYKDSTEWIPYAGTGPAFGLSHRSVAATDVDDPDVTEEDKNRFNFSDTDFNFGMNFIFGVKKASGLFVEMRATAWGVSNIRLVAGFNF